MFGSLITFASGCSAVRLIRQAHQVLRCASVRYSGNAAKIRPERNVAGFDINIGMAGKRLHDWQQGLSGQCRSFVGVGIDNGGFSHGIILYVG